MFAGPEGEAASGSEISIVFNRPLRALDVAGSEAPPPIVMQPALEGRWQWVGTNALIFVPSRGRLPGATRTSVTVPATARALDGSTLAKPYRFEFETPRPKLVRSNPQSNERGITPDTKLELFFNQPLDPKKLEQLGTLTAKTGAKTSRLSFSARRPDPNSRKRLELRPTSPLPIHSTITLTISKELRSEEGPLPPLAPIELSFQTYGPLVVERVSCPTDTPHGRCAPGSSVGVQLSNPVKLKDARRLVSITPAVKLNWDSWHDESELTTWLQLVAPFKAAANYTLRIGGELRDRYGQKLGKPHVQVVSFDDHDAQVEIGTRGDYLEPAVARAIPVGSVNVDRYELVTAPLTADDVMKLSLAPREAERLGLVEKLSSAKKRQVNPRVAKNQLATERIDAAPLLGPAQRGPLAVGVRYRNPERPGPDEIVRIVQLTDLALSAKLSRHGSLVWVTRLSNGQPVSGATLELRVPGRAPRRYQADAQGLARISASEFSPNFYEDQSSDARGVLFARSGDDWTYRPVQDYVDPWRAGVNVDLSGTQRPYGLMFTERGIYRPGDKLQLKGIVRLETPTGSAVPAGRRLEIVMSSPDGEEAQRRSVTTTRFGSFAVELSVPQAAALGSWQVAARGLPHGELTESFEVAEYRPAEFKAAVESDRPSYVRGDEARWVGRGDYLFGAPMAKAAARYNVTRAPTSFAPPDSDAFVTDASAHYADLEEESVDSGELLAAEGRLDTRGELRFSQRLELPGQRGPELVSASTEVTDISRQAIASTTSAVVHPAEYYVGIQTPDDWFVKAPGPVVINVVALNADGQRLGGKRVLVELIRRRFTLARQDTGAALRSLSRPVDTPAGNCLVTTAATPQPCKLEVPEGGYFIVQARGKDARGNQARAALGIYAIGAGGGSWGERDDHKLELVPNKKAYKLGERARVLVKSPFAEADAIVTVERAGIYRIERTRLKGPTPTVEVPITDELRPNAFVGVHLIRPRVKAAPGARAQADGLGGGRRASAGPADVGAPTYRIGYAPLVIDPEPRRLKLEVKPDRRDHRPGDELKVDVSVRDHQGRPRSAEVTLYAVDEGVLSLIGYKTPDPVPVFTAARPLQVASLESRDALARLSLDALGGALGLNKGQEGGGGGSGSVRRDFRQSAFFDADIVTDSAGRASVRFKLPDSLTTYRMMAVAATDSDQYGFGEARVTTSKRLMARPALPRFLRAGDVIEAGVVVSGKGFGPATVNVRATTRGIELGSDALRTVRVGRDESVEVRFAMRAQKAGKASFKFDVSGEHEKDAVELERRIDSPAVMEAVALYGETQSEAGEKLGDLSQIRRDVGSLDLSVASTALVGLEGGVEQLVEYPYGCTEQVASRLMPLVALRDLAKDFAIPLLPDTPKIVQKGLADLLTRQRGDGGFGMWPDSPDSSPWVSAYALWTLHQGRLRGAPIPPKTFDRGRDYLRRFLDEIRQERVYLATAAFVVDVLAELGAPDTGYMSRLYQERNTLPVFARALLLHAMAISKQKRELVDVLKRELENQLRLDGNSAFVNENLGDEYAVLMDSQARTGAIVLRGLLSASPEHALGSKLARGLLAQRRGGTWRSTQESAWALLALDAYRKAQEKALPDYVARIWLGEAELLRAPMRGRSTKPARETIALSALKLGPGGVLAFQKQGDGTLFYEARLRYAKSRLPAQPLDRGFFVQKTLRAVSPETLAQALGTIPEKSASALKGGDLAIVDLVVVTPSPREYVVIDDPLAAGLEAVDARLATTAAWLDVPHSGGEPGEVDCLGCDQDSDDDVAHGRAFLSSWYRRELRDDRVVFFVDHMAAGMYHYRYLVRATTLGRFVVPPTKAEEMYSPEVFGRTAAALLEIR